MQYRYETLNSKADGLSLSLQVAEPTGCPRGVLQISHGMAEHKERYEPLMEFLAEQGIVVAIHDHRGHGKSVRAAEDLGYFYADGARALVEDLHQVTAWLRREYARELPLYLLGHSMGSLAARAYCQEFDAELDGLIVCGSPSYHQGSRFGRTLARHLQRRKGGHHRSSLLQAMAFGPFAARVKRAKTVVDWICTDEQVVSAYQGDPLCGFVFTANGFEALFDLMAMAYAKDGWGMQNPHLPIWFISGAEDPCMGDLKKFGRAVDFLRDKGYREVSATFYPKMRHEILNEHGKEQVFSDIASKLRQWGLDRELSESCRKRNGIVK